MGWYSGSASAAGDFLTAINNNLVANHATWSSYDSGFATNEEVFRCLDAPNNVEFYLYCRESCGRDGIRVPMRERERL